MSLQTFLLTLRAFVGFSGEFPGVCGTFVGFNGEFLVVSGEFHQVM